MIPPPVFRFRRLPGLTVRPAFRAAAAAAAVCVFLHRRKAAPVPGLPVDGAPLTAAEKAAWEQFKDAAMSEAIRDAGLGILRPEAGQ